MATKLVQTKITNTGNPTTGQRGFIPSSSNRKTNNSRARANWPTSHHSLEDNDDNNNNNDDDDDDDDNDDNINNNTLGTLTLKK